MANFIFCFFESLLSKHRQNAGKQFIEKFALATQVTADEVDKMKNDLGLDIQTAVKAKLLMDVYGIHLALLGDAARKLIKYTNKNDFETAMLSRYIEASLNKLGLIENVQGMYQEISQHIKDMDSAFYANLNGTHDPFTAATKQFLRITCGKDYVDIAVMTVIVGAIGSEMKHTNEMFKGLYENGYRY